MSSSDTELDALRGEEAARQTSRPTRPPVAALYANPETRICHFYKDGDKTFGGLKMCISSRMYPSMEVLKTELTSRVHGLPYGVRSIFTPRGRTSIDTVSKLQHEGQYICSTYSTHAHGLRVTDIDGKPSWRTGVRPSSGKHALAALLKDVNRQPPLSDARQAWASDSEVVVSSGAATNGTSRVPKKITVILGSDTSQRQTLLLSRRTRQSFEQVLHDLSTMFHTPVRRMYTMDGRQVGILYILLL